jgi:hypothetical protein
MMVEGDANNIHIARLYDWVVIHSEIRAIKDRYYNFQKKVAYLSTRADSWTNKAAMDDCRQSVALFLHITTTAYLFLPYWILATIPHHIELR